MPDLSNAEISVEGEYGECLVCGESFHWEQLTNLKSGSYCETHIGRVTMTNDDGEVLYDSWSDDEADMGHDTALERDTFGDAL